MNRPLVILDTETATLVGAPHLIELGAVRVVDGEAVDHFRSIVRPQIAIEPEATSIHGLADDDVRNAPDAGDVLSRFAEWTGDDWMAAHNASFDARVLGFEYARTGLAPPPGPLIDSLPLARRCFPEALDHKLLTLAELVGVEVDEAHRALPDAVLCWQVIEACVERLGGWDAVGEADVLGRSGRPITIAGAIPRPPGRSPARVRRLERARREGVSVHLLYGESSESPARLEVLPQLLYQENRRAYLEGECVASGILKTYRIDRIHRIETID